MNNSIYNFSKDKLVLKLEELNQKKFRATQIYEALYRQKVKDFFDISNLSNDSKKVLKENFSLEEMEVIKEVVSNDGTRKYLFKLFDNNIIETVLMNQSYGLSVCITSQVGCNIGCLFCASSQTKKIRNLTASEMVLQVLQIDNILNNESKRVTHVVVMGIGEPFDNFDNLIEFIKIINDPKGLGIGVRHITISTSGIIPNIYKLALLNMQVNLAISLHFALDSKRSKYMPINKKYNLKDLKIALFDYFNKTKRRITFEYIMLDGLNDSKEDCFALIEYLKGFNCYVNLIPYNKTDVNLEFKTSKNTNQFFQTLIKNNINVILRKEHGVDIDAACGQLRIKHVKGEV